MKSNKTAIIVDGEIHLVWQGVSREDFTFIKEVVKTIASRKFVKDRPSYWRVDLNPWNCKDVVDKLKPYKFFIDPDITKLAKEADIMIKKSSAKRGKKKVDKRLYPFQQAAIDFTDLAEGRLIIGDQMGLGKTVENLVWAQVTSDVKKILVVAPANVIYKWDKEFDTWTDRFTHAVVPSSKGDMPDVDALIMSYGIMIRRVDELYDMGFDLFTVDEFHYIKNPKAQRTRAAKKIGIHCKYVALLSGSPMLNRPIEMWNGLKLIRPFEWLRKTDYVWQYCAGWTEAGWGMGATNTEELAERLRTTMIRRLKKDVLKQLPDMTRTYIEINPDISNYGAVEDEAFAAIAALPRNKSFYVNALAHLAALRQIVGMAKAKAAIPWIENFFEQADDNTKLVVYCHHHAIVNYLEGRLKDYGVTTITGKVPAAKRPARIDSYQTTGGPRVIVITSAGGEGIDLFGIGGVDSSNILFVERQWGPVPEEQAEARLHRMGQSNAVVAYYLIARDTIDDDISSLIEAKREVIDTVIGGPEISMTIVPDLLKLLKGGKK